ncbi:hypothetical protein RF11_15335 [Thelohanellus kitauei]|uniref:Uncharacterized protein n=1 Tax=Thelohanellus kitauei TaxID=669202 RepID=A0A0C2I585_THEKT|nr:hypothetical protein RF11_15335 [Thelohanellus kitauei]
MVSAGENWKYDFLEDPRSQFDDLEIIGEIKENEGDNKPGSDDDQYNNLKIALIKLYDTFNKPLDEMSEFMKLSINPGERLFEFSLRVEKVAKLIAECIP